MTFPAFTKVGTVFSAPAWLTSLTLKLMFPRIIENDLYRATLPSLPASRFSCLWSSDHSAGAGYIGRADFDDIEATWTDSGGYIHSGVNQRETPHPVFDPVNSRINVYVHDVGSTVTYGNQAARLLTTTDLDTLTDQGQLFNYGMHTGYGDYQLRDGTWHAYHLYLPSVGFVDGYSTSATGAVGSWSLQRRMHSNAQHLIGTGNNLTGTSRYFQYGGRWYRLSAIAPHPRLTGYPGNITSIVAFPIDITTLRPTGGYYTLVTPGAGGANDEAILNYVEWIEVDGDYYIVYVGQKADGSQRLMLSKATVGSSTQSDMVWPVTSSGALQGDTLETVDVDWDAANDALPAGITKVVGSGSDASAQSAGNYYELKTGSGSAQDIYLRSTSTFDLTANETTEFVIEGLRIVAADPFETQLQFGFVSTISATTNGAFLYCSSNQAIREEGSLRLNSGGSLVSEAATYSIAYGSTVGDVGNFARTTPLKLTIRIHDHGSRFTLLVDDHVAYHKDISSNVTWSANCFCFFRLFNATPFPQHYARFTRMTVRTFEGMASTGRTGMNNRTLRPY